MVVRDGGLRSVARGKPRELMDDSVAPVRPEIEEAKVFGMCWICTLSAVVLAAAAAMGKLLPREVACNRVSTGGSVREDTGGRLEAVLVRLISGWVICAIGGSLSNACAVASGDLSSRSTEGCWMMWIGVG